MIVLHGCKPGSTVSFPLKIHATSIIVHDDEGNSRTFSGTKKELIGGDGVLKVTATVPAAAKKREIDALLTASAEHDKDGKIRIVSRREAFERWRTAAIRAFVQRIDDFKIVDTRAADDPEMVLWIHTVDELLEHADDDVLNAIVDVVLDRARLADAVAGKFADAQPGEVIADGGDKAGVQ